MRTLTQFAHHHSRTLWVIPILLFAGSAAAQQNVPAREYIRLGGRVVAIENRPGVTAPARLTINPAETITFSTEASFTWTVVPSTAGSVTQQTGQAVFQPSALAGATSVPATITASLQNTPIYSADVIVRPALCDSASRCSGDGGTLGVTGDGTATSGILTVTSSGTWTAAPGSGGWLHITSSSQSAGTVAFAADANASGADRFDSITISGGTPSPITYTMTQHAVSVVVTTVGGRTTIAPGETVQLQATTSPAGGTITWSSPQGISLSGNPATFTAPAFSQGAVSQNYSFTATSINPAASATPFDITVKAPLCDVGTGNCTSRSVPGSSAASGTFCVTMGGSWSLSSSATWLSVPSSTYSDNRCNTGAIAYSVASGHYGEQATVSLMKNGVAQASFTVSVSGAQLCSSGTTCTTSVTVPATGGSASLDVRASGAWTAQSSVPAWLQITAGSSGTGNGNGVISYSASAQSPGAAARSAAINLTAGTSTAQFTVQQLAAPIICPTTASLSPSLLIATPTQQYQFSFVTDSNDPTATIAWSISPQYGTIDSSGLYSAPSTNDQLRTLTLTASSTSPSCPARQASTQISLVANNPTGYAWAPAPGTWSFTTNSAATLNSANLTTSDPSFSNPVTRYYWRVAYAIADDAGTNPPVLTNSCYGDWYGSDFAHLYDDAAQWPAASGGVNQFSFGGGGTPENLQCRMSFPSSTRTLTGSGVNLAPNLTFLQGYAGAKALYLQATNNGSVIVPWTRIGYVNISTSNVTVSVSPSSSVRLATQTQQFTATVTGTSNTAVTWSASPSTYGTIGSSSGLFTAASVNATSAAPLTATITATSQADSTKSATAAVTVIPVNLTLSSLSAASGTTGYQASNSITANTAVTVSGSADVTFRAPGTITLGPGFHATGGTAGTTFRAVIAAPVQ